MEMQYCVWRIEIVRNNIAAVSTQIRGVFGSGYDSPSTLPILLIM